MKYLVQNLIIQHLVTTVFLVNIVILIGKKNCALYMVLVFNQIRKKLNTIQSGQQYQITLLLFINNVNIVCKYRRM